MGLRFDEREIGGPHVAVGAEDAEQVWETGNGDAFVGLQPVLIPEPGQRTAAAAGDREGRDTVGVHHFEPGRQHQHVDLVALPVGGGHAARHDLGDRLGHQPHIVAVERRQIRVVEAGPLAADGVLRG
jgi:hypothetical protein